ncbi:MAG: MarR family transcriptional regulator [Solirubrobacterales bacterium]|nr:MarR family transcriptional regulator [Solirubrobacterales bacterium]
MLHVQLTAEELAAWTGFLRAHGQIVSGLDEELRREHDLPLSSYDVLTQLESAPGAEIRMSELAEAVLLSRSGLTRLVDRLERQGLLERRECPEDARGFNAALTELGIERLREARATHRDGVRRLYLNRLDPAEQARLAGVWARLLEGT